VPRPSSLGRGFPSTERIRNFPTLNVEEHDVRMAHLPGQTGTRHGLTFPLMSASASRSRTSGETLSAYFSNPATRWYNVTDLSTTRVIALTSATMPPSVTNKIRALPKFRINPKHRVFRQLLWESGLSYTC
jgi:hypothetical protein